MSKWPYTFDTKIERIGLSGKARLSHYGPEGKLIGERKTPNTVVTTGKAQVAGLICGVVTDHFEYVAIGTGTTATSAASTALSHEATRATAATSRVTTTVTNDTAQLVKTFSFNAASAITESGVQDSASEGTMLCRATFSAINVSSGDSLQVTWKVKAA